MAVFLTRSLLGGDTFPYVTTPYFTDAPSTHAYFKYIQKIRELAITTGCTAATYCPDNPVTRGQMAVFLVRAVLGNTFTYNPTPYFTDVPATHPYFSFIQKLRDLGITSGCSATKYCSDAANTRREMAVFLVRTVFAPG
jgi:hypothetical protein